MRDPASQADQEPDAFSPEEQASLEELLSQVVAPPSQDAPKRRTRRKLRRGVSRTQNARASADEKQEQAEVAPPIRLRVRQKGPVRITVRREAHVQSPFVVSVQGLVQPIHTERRSAREKTIHKWNAPSNVSVSSEGLLAEALDLHISDLDPFLFHEQFTSSDADRAFAETYGFWTRLQMSFIRWDVERAERPANGFVAPEVDTDIQIASMPEEDEEVLPVDFDRQWSIPPSEARFSFASRLADARDRLSSLFSRTTGRIEDVITSVEEREEAIIGQTESEWGMPVLVPRLDFVKIFGGLTALLLMASLPAGAVSLSRSFRGTIEESVRHGQSAVEQVDRITQSSDIFSDAPSVLTVASERFRAAEDSLREVSGITTLIVRSLPQTREAYDSGVALLDAGTQATKAARLVSEGVREALSLQSSYPVERLVTLQSYIDAAIPTLQKAKDRIREVRPEALPESQHERVVAAQAAIEGGATALEGISSTLRFARLLMGESREQTYLLVFQNQAELRPTGGFMGSVAELMIDRGNINQVFVPGGGPYDLRSQLKSRVLAPKPLHLVNPRWEFQDANWFPDFAASAEKISWFWSDGGQSTLDGVIAINASILEPLLQFTGPIALPEYGKSFTAENIQFELQKAVELEYDKTENKPKKIIGDLFPVLLKRLQSAPPEDMVKLISLLDESLRTKDVQLWFRDEALQGYTERFGWAGRIKPTKGDALSVIGANIGGQKTDAVIREAIDQEVRIAPDGTIEATVTLDRTHDGTQGQLFRGANNVEYVRVYVPLGSELLSVEGVRPPTTTAYKLPIAEDLPDPDLERYVTLPRMGPSEVDITQEFGRTAFGAWVQLMPGAQSRTTFRYKLPFTVQELSEQATTDHGTSVSAQGGAYTLYLTSQSGKADRQLNLRIRYPKEWAVRWTNREDVSRAPGLSAWAGPLDEDQVFALSFILPSSYDQIITE